MIGERSKTLADDLLNELEKGLTVVRDGDWDIIRWDGKVMQILKAGLFDAL